MNDEVTRSWSGGGHVDLAIGDCDIRNAISFAGIVQTGFGSSGWFLSFNADVNQSGSYYGFGIEGEQFKLYKAGEESTMPTAYPFSPVQWCFVAVTKPAGLEPAKLYVYRFDDEEWTVQSGSPINDVEVAAPTSIRLGRWNGVEDYEGLAAVFGLWDKELTEEEIKSMIEVETLSEWLLLEPKGLWPLGQEDVETEEVLDITENGADQTGRSETIQVFEPSPIPYGEGAAPEPAPPIAITENASAVTDKTAKLNGKVDANGAPTEYWFEYEEDGSAVVKKVPIGEDGDAGKSFLTQPFSQNVTGLKPNTKYNVVIKAKSELGEDAGETKSFTTEEEGEEPPPEGPTMQVSVGGDLVEGVRYVKVGGELVPA